MFVQIHILFGFTFNDNNNNNVCTQCSNFDRPTDPPNFNSDALKTDVCSGIRRPFVTAPYTLLTQYVPFTCTFVFSAYIRFAMFCRMEISNNLNVSSALRYFCFFTLNTMELKDK